MRQPPECATGPTGTPREACPAAKRSQPTSIIAPAAVTAQVEPLAAEGARVAGLIGAPLAVSREQAAALCGLSARSWTRYDSQGLVPAALRCGGRRVYAVAELTAWVNAGMPPRARWEAMRRTEAAR